MSQVQQANFFAGILKVYRTPPYWIITLLAAAAYLLVAIWIPQWSLIRYTFGSPVYTVIEKTHVLLESLRWFVTYGTWVSQINTVIISLLVGINTAVCMYYISLRLRFGRAAGSVGIIAMLSGLFGVGCSACGPVLLSSMIGLSAATGVIALLPLKGLEFSVISLILLIFSIYFLVRSIQRPNTC